MAKQTVKSGKGELTLRKSETLVGVRTAQTRSLTSEEAPDYIEQEVYRHLGGFQVVSLKAGEAGVDTKLDEVRSRDDVEVGTHVYYAEGSNRPLVPTGEIYIDFEDGVSEEEQDIALDEFALELVERRGPLSIVARVSSQSPNPIKVAAALQAVCLVRRAEPDLDTVLDAYEFAVPADHLLRHEWHLENIGYVADTFQPLKAGADSRVVAAWRRLGNLGSANITLAVIDNGFDLRHPDLRNKVVAPFDLWTQSTNVLQGDPRFTHGTPCASVALAESNGQGIVGVAPLARFMPVSGTSFSVRATEQMFDYCARNGADIISCSWGTTDPNFSLSPAKVDAITRAARNGREGKGCVIVFAVGNDGLDIVNFYAAHPDVIAVAASTSRDEYAPYSNRGREVSVCAPSNGDWPIIAARAWWDQGQNWQSGNFRFWLDGRSRGEQYQHFGGTSSAAPLVAGICALILSANPDLTAREVKEILQQTADRIGSSFDYINGHSTKFGYGRVNAERAVAEAQRRRSARPAYPGVPASPSPSSPNPVPASTPVTAPTSVPNPSRPAPAAVSAGWGVQTGAYSSQSNALLQSEQLRRRFSQPVQVTANAVNGRMIYKTVVGNFADSSAAHQLLRQLQAAGINGFVVQTGG